MRVRVFVYVCVEHNKLLHLLRPQKNEETNEREWSV